MGDWGCRSRLRRGGDEPGERELAGVVLSARSSGKGTAVLGLGCVVLATAALIRRGASSEGPLAGSIYPATCTGGRSAPPLNPPGWDTEYPLPPLTAMVFASFRCVRYGVVWKEGQALVRGGAPGPAVLAEGVEGARSDRSSPDAGRGRADPARGEGRWDSCGTGWAPPSDETVPDSLPHARVDAVHAAGRVRRRPGRAAGFRPATAGRTSSSAPARCRCQARASAAQPT